METKNYKMECLKNLKFENKLYEVKLNLHKIKAFKDLTKVLRRRKSLTMQRLLNAILSDYSKNQRTNYFEKHIKTACVVLNWLKVLPKNIHLNGNNLLYAVIVADRLDLLKEIFEMYEMEVKAFMVDAELFQYGNNKCYKYACDTGCFNLTEDNTYDFGLNMTDEQVESYFEKHADSLSIDTIIELISGITRYDFENPLADHMCQYMVDHFKEEQEREDILCGLGNYACFDLMEKYFPGVDIDEY